MNADPAYLILSLVILIYSAILHEIAHGVVAERLGDPTARLLGRITLNPIPHIDPYMTILLPLLTALSPLHLVIGGAKPVPVDPFNFRDGRKDLAIVSLAGPGTNFLIAVGFAGIAHILFPGMEFLQIINSGILGLFVGLTIEINLLLGIFNLVPIPPLDGSKIFSLLLSEKEASRFMEIGNMGMLLIIGFLYFFGGVLSTFLSSALHLLGL